MTPILWMRKPKQSEVKITCPHVSKWLSQDPNPGSMVPGSVNLANQKQKNLILAIETVFSTTQTEPQICF